MNQEITTLTAIVGALFYVFPKVSAEIHPKEIHIILKDGIIVNAICRRKYGKRGGQESNILNDILGGVATMTSTLLLGELAASRVGQEMRSRRWTI